MMQNVRLKCESGRSKCGHGSTIIMQRHLHVTHTILLGKLTSECQGSRVSWQEQEKMRGLPELAGANAGNFARKEGKPSFE